MEASSKIPTALSSMPSRWCSKRFSHGKRPVRWCASCAIRGCAYPVVSGTVSRCTCPPPRARARVSPPPPADPVDQQVVVAFFDALAPAELDLYEQALAQRRQQQAELDQAQRYSVQRLEYEADQARRRY